MVHDFHKHNHGLYLSVQPILSEDALPWADLTARVKALLPDHPDNNAYLTSLIPPAAHPSVKRQRLSALLCALSLMEEIFGEIPPSLRLFRDANGRPFATAEATVPYTYAFDFNLSHTKGYVACGILVGGGRLGVDIEPVMAEERARKLAPRFFSAGEQIRLNSAPQNHLSEEATRIWTAKEALSKQDGRGFPPDFDSTAPSPEVILYHGRISEDPVSQQAVAVTVCAPRTCPPPRLSAHSCAILWQHSL